MTTVRTITTAEHLAFVEELTSASYLQTPAWAGAKPEWRSESIGWFESTASPDGTGGERMVGAALVLYRQLPKVRRYLAYLPEGPLLDYDTDDLGALLDPMTKHLKRRGAFGVRLGPQLVWRTWRAETIKAAVADEAVRALGEVRPDSTDPVATRTRNQLRSLGWRPPREGAGFSAGQPTYRFWLRLTGHDEDSLLKGMNQLWRRNIKKATKSGVEVRLGGRAELADFHRIYAETAGRDGFTPRPLSYFETMWDALASEAEDRIRLYLAEHEGDLVAATIWTRVGGHVWYAYGASTSAKRDVRGSNAIQWQMVRDALAAGAEVYDLRGITDSVAADDPHLGLIQFKVGTGGEAYDVLGEWDLPLNRPLYAAFDLYLRRRG